MIFSFFFSELHHSEALSPDVTPLSLSSDTTMSPSPPLSTTAASGHLKPQGIRVRRLQLSQGSSEHLPNSSGVGCFPGTGTTAGDPGLQRVKQVTRTNVPLLSQAAHIPCPPPKWYGNNYYITYIY